MSKREKYRKIMSQLYIGRKVIHKNKIKTVTDISKCHNQGTAGLSCDVCIGYISLDNEGPLCYSSCYKCFFDLWNEDFLKEEEFEI